MNSRIALFLILFIVGMLSCGEDDKVEDPVYEFVSFQGNENVDIGESTNSEESFPLVIQLWAFDPYSEDLSVNFDVAGNNTQEGVDFIVTPTGSVTIPSGSLVSDTIWIKTINNTEANELERTFEVKLNSVSEPDINVGLGITEPTNDIVIFKILDDECSGDPICTFNTALTNNISAPDGSWTDVKPATGVVDKINSTLTVAGDLIAYGTFPNATLTITLTPSEPGSATGVASFGEQETGTDNDGYAYKFEEVGTGSYDADAGLIKIEYDIYYWDGDWVYWYSVVNEFTLP